MKSPLRRPPPSGTVTFAYPAAVTSARSTCQSSSSRAWTWISFPPRSLSSSWARSRASRSAAHAAGVFASSILSILSSARSSLTMRRHAFTLFREVTPSGVPAGPSPLGPRASKGIGLPGTETFRPRITEGPCSAPIIDYTPPGWSPRRIVTCIAVDSADPPVSMVENYETTDCLFSSVLSLLQRSTVPPPPAQASALRSALAGAKVSPREVRALVPGPPGHSLTISRIERALRTVSDLSTPCGLDELLLLCAWLGVRFEVLTFPNNRASPRVIDVPPRTTPITADTPILAFAGTLALWWPSSECHTGHWDALFVQGTPLAPDTDCTQARRDPQRLTSVSQPDTLKSPPPPFTTSRPTAYTTSRTTAQTERQQPPHNGSPYGTRTTTGLPPHAAPSSGRSCPEL